MKKTTKLIATPMELNWPYKRHYEIFKGIQEYGSQYGNWVLDPSNHPELALARGKHFDGIVGRITPECLKAAQNASIPVVNVWVESPIYDQIPRVQIDSYESGRLATEHLIARGFRRFAYFGLKSTRASVAHFKGVSDTAIKHGHFGTRHLVSVHWDETREDWARFEDFVVKAQRKWVRPIGVVCVSDELARALTMIFLRLGWMIPEQLAIVGLGNDTLICTAADPSLTSVAMNYEQYGFEAARMLASLMSGVKPPRDTVLIPPREIVVRTSSDVFSVSDPKVAQALRHMADHCSETMSVPDIARAVGIGRKTLERRFQRHVGHTINDELIRIRVAKLQRLLIESKSNVSELGEAAGFGNFVSMHKMFKRATGMTPGEYRERHGGHPAR